MDDLALKRAQIRKTIEEHLDKEIELNRKGIKVLSLFFIDRVSNYRVYDEEGNYHNGIYADIFEEEYNRVIQKPKYSTLYNYEELKNSASEVHNGYFSMDKKGAREYKQKKNGEFTLSKADDDTFNLIMKDKEKLLSFDSKLRFIFSHSALREGWDNPNVFQICTLNETTSNMKKRQEIGRGLRLCVNQDGERIHDKSTNILTVMANESYESFARSLQSEMEEETGIKFGVIEKDSGVRGAPDYRKDACLNLKAFEAIILQCIIYYNRERVLRNHPYTQSMLDSQIPPHPSDIWNYGLKQPGANLISTSKETLIKILLPRTKGIFTQRGLVVNKIRYKSDGYTEQYLSGGSVTVAYNPDNVSYVYLIKDNYTKFNLIESRFEGLTLDAAKHMMTQQKELILTFEEKSLQAKVNLVRHIQSIADANKRNTCHLDTRNVSRARANERYNKHQDLISEVPNE